MKKGSDDREEDQKKGDQKEVGTTTNSYLMVDPNKLNGVIPRLYNYADYNQFSKPTDDLDISTGQPLPALSGIPDPIIAKRIQLPAGDTAVTAFGWAASGEQDNGLVRNGSSDYGWYQSTVQMFRITDTGFFFPQMTAGSVLFAGASGLVSQNNASLFWDNVIGVCKFGANPQSTIYAAATTAHLGTNIFAEFGEGIALGNPSGTVTAVVGIAGGLTGAYKYAYYEKDLDGNSTGLSPVSATVNPVAQRVTVTLPRARNGVASRVLCRTVAGGSTYLVLQNFGPSYEFHQTIYDDNVADGSLGTQAPSSDSTMLYNLSVRRGAKFICTHPSQAGTASDLTLLTGNPNAAAEWALDAYNSVVARQSLGINFYSIHSGNSGYHIQADYNSDTYGSTIYSPFLLLPRGDLLLAPVPYTSGLPTAITLTTPSHTGMTATLEDISVRFNFSATKSWATGDIVLQREFMMDAPTLAFVGASTVTSATTFAITGQPLPGANATISNSYAMTIGTPNAPSLTGIHQLGIFFPGTCQSIYRNTTNNQEMFWLIDATDGYFGMMTASGLNLRTTNLTRLSLSSAGYAAFTSTAGSSGLPLAFSVTTPAHAGMTASTEDLGVRFNLSATKTWAAGALTLQREFLVDAPAYAFASASTITSAVTFAITGVPGLGSNATITNQYGLTVGAVPSSPTLTGSKAMGLFNAGTTQAIMRNTSANLEMHWIVDATDGYFGMGTNTALNLRTNNSLRFTITADGQMVSKATFSTGMTSGFFMIPGAAGAPSGTPTSITGFPAYWDSTNLQLCIYSGGAWKKSAAFT